MKICPYSHSLDIALGSDNLFTMDKFPWINENICLYNNFRNSKVIVENYLEMIEESSINMFYF